VNFTPVEFTEGFFGSARSNFFKQKTVQNSKKVVKLVSQLNSSLPSRDTSLYYNPNQFPWLHCYQNATKKTKILF
jgi:hypothetical protein